MQTTIVLEIGGDPEETNSLSFSSHALPPMLGKVSIHCPISLGGHMFLGIKS